MTLESKLYFLEQDVIQIAEEESIKFLTRGGNSVYIDIKNLERQSSIEEKKGIKGPFSSTLDYLNDDSLTYKNGVIQLANGGRIITTGISKEKEIEAIHLTNSSSIKSKLKREGRNVEKPSFLHYGPEILDEAIIRINHSDYDKFKKISSKSGIRGPNIEDLSNITGKEYYNNQIIKIGKEYYKVELNLLKEQSKKDNHFDKGRYTIDENTPGNLILLNPQHTRSSLPNFNPRNLEQKLGFQQLTQFPAELSIIVGGSGSGKSVLTYAAAVQLISHSKQGRKPDYDGIILFKSNDIIGGTRREMGFLPGSAYEKVKPFMKSYEDAHDLIGLSNFLPFSDMLAHPFNESDDFGKRSQNNLGGGLKLSEKNRAIEIEHLQFARGRTFEHKIIFVDEAQNFSPFEMKQLIERVGIGSKIYLVGDPEQVDNPLLSPSFNGLTYAAAINYGVHPRFTITKLGQNYRSQSAEIMRNKKAPGEHL